MAGLAIVEDTEECLSAVTKPKLVSRKRPSSAEADDVLERVPEKVLKLFGFMDKFIEAAQAASGRCSGCWKVGNSAIHSLCLLTSICFNKLC